MWVPQWPLSSEKLAATRELVAGQLALKHIKPSVSPWNTPIFVIKKKSGKWRLLHDLRAINRQMQIMGPVQRGLPLLTALPERWPIIVIDIKDCFFSIPLSERDTERFAFTVPSCNHEEPDQRFEWVVLPQGMANSPTMCQLFVSETIAPLRKKYPTLKCIHYMDDILLAEKTETLLDQAYEELVQILRGKGLYIAPEKVQRGEVVNYLGACIKPMEVVPQKLELRKDGLRTLNDFQKLLGNINWVRSYLKLPNHELKPLYDVLIGDSALNSPRVLTPEARLVLEKVERSLQGAFLKRWDANKPLTLCILATLSQPTGLLWQEGPLLWIHSRISPAKSIQYYPSAVADLALTGIQQCIQFFGILPTTLVVPYSSYQVQTLCGALDEWAVLRCGYPGEIDNHYPKHPLVSFFKEHPVIFPKITAVRPLSSAPNIFTDGSKTGCGAYVIEHQEPVRCHFQPGSPQIVELQIVIEVFKRCHFPFNLISDSAYVVNAVKVLEAAGPIKRSSTVCALLKELQDLIWHRTQRFYIQHIRAHTGLPGPLSEGNNIVDKLARQDVLLMAPAMERARRFHELFHVNAKTLQKKFNLPRADARQVVLGCPQCVTFQHPPSVGINPRGLRPGVLWQMDVTHFSEFGTLKYLHVSVDTCSGVIMATPLSGEKARNVITHCLEAWAAWGMPQILKTDNGPAYTARSFVSFCQQMGVRLTHGLPYNPQGQGIVERAHRTLKECLLKQKGGIGHGRTPKERLSLALFTLNFLNLDINGHSAAERHHMPHGPQRGMVKWKDILTGTWHGPDPVLTWARGSVCVFPQDKPDPVWVPERLVRKVQDAPPPKNTPDAPDDCGGDAGDDGASLGNPVRVSKADADTA